MRHLDDTIRRECGGDQGAYVRLSYLGKPWCTVPLEVGHNEIGDAHDAD